MPRRPRPSAWTTAAVRAGGAHGALLASVARTANGRPRGRAPRGGERKRPRRAPGDDPSRPARLARAGAPGTRDPAAGRPQAAADEAPAARLRRLVAEGAADAIRVARRPVRRCARLRAHAAATARARRDLPARDGHARPDRGDAPRPPGAGGRRTCPPRAAHRGCRIPATVLREGAKVVIRLAEPLDRRPASPTPHSRSGSSTSWARMRRRIRNRPTRSSRGCWRGRREPPRPPTRKHGQREVAR